MYRKKQIHKFGVNSRKKITNTPSYIAETVEETIEKEQDPMKKSIT